MLNLEKHFSEDQDIYMVLKMSLHRMLIAVKKKKKKQLLYNEEAHTSLSLGDKKLMLPMKDG